MKLPPKNDNYRRIYAYLIQTRVLSQEVVSDFVHRRLIYEDAHKALYGRTDADGAATKKWLLDKYRGQGYSVGIELPEQGKDFNEMLLRKKADALAEKESEGVGGHEAAASSVQRRRRGR